VSSLLSSFTFVSPEDRKFTDPYSLAHRAAIQGNSESLGRVWGDLSQSERTKIFATSIVIGSAEIVDFILDRGVDPLSIDSDGQLLYFSSTSKDVSSLIEAAADELKGEDLAIHLIHRIITGLTSSLRSLKLSGGFPNLPDADSFLNEESHPFERRDSIEIRLEAFNDDVVQFYWLRNWGFLSGSQGAGRFVKHGKFWKIHW